MDGADELRRRLSRADDRTKRAVDAVLTAFEAGEDPAPILVAWIGEEAARPIIQTWLAGIRQPD